MSGGKDMRSTREVFGVMDARTGDILAVHRVKSEMTMLSDRRNKWEEDGHRTFVIVADLVNVRKVGGGSIGGGG